MSTTKSILQTMNPTLFNFRQPSILHDIYVVGIRTTNPETKVQTTNFVQTSKPSAEAIAAGVKPSDYIHTSFKPVGSIKIDEQSGEETFSGPKKAQIGVVFQTAQPDLFNFLKRAIDEGKDKGYIENGIVQITDPKTGKVWKRPQILLKRKLFGKIIAMNVPEYTPHNMGADGKPHALAPTTLDPLTGRYGHKEVVSGSIKFFADDDDLDLLEEAAAKIVDKRVRPWVKDKKTLIIEDSFGNKRVEVKEAELSSDEPDTDNIETAESEKDEEPAIN